jgi:hypothetical protein
MVEGLRGRYAKDLFHLLGSANVDSLLLVGEVGLDAVEIV